MCFWPLTLAVARSVVDNVKVQELPANSSLAFSTGQSGESETADSVGLSGN